ncbi:MAG: nucleoside-diphosphate kinase [Parachlamydiales bacterium]|jgi:nucleoside-diphosphate kinase
MLFRFLAIALLMGSSLCALNKETTLAIIKPDAVASNHVGDILSRYEKSGLKIAGIKMNVLSEVDAKQFYAIHKGKPFYNDLVKFMTSGPSVILVLEGDNAVQRNRDLIGSGDKKGSLRADFGTSMTKNAIHGSDSIENAQQEVGFFFSNRKLQERF